mmetsp:Transcript_83439/g.257964  ORF Transcript_83439/g.257964 Transcript_83439/m.257964 type:complete len:248 (+) Transcript_83439:132-875(+)
MKPSRPRKAPTRVAAGAAQPLEPPKRLANCATKTRKSPRACRRTGPWRKVSRILRLRVASMRASCASLESRDCRCSSSRPCTSFCLSFAERSSALCCASRRSFSASSSCFCLSALPSSSSTILRWVLRSAASWERFSSARSASSSLTFLSAAPSPAAFGGTVTSRGLGSGTRVAFTGFASSASASGGALLPLPCRERLCRRDLLAWDSTTGRAPRCSASVMAWWPLAEAMASAVEPWLLARSRMAPR